MFWYFNQKYKKKNFCVPNKLFIDISMKMKAWFFTISVRNNLNQPVLKI